MESPRLLPGRSNDRVLVRLPRGLVPSDTIPEFDERLASGRAKIIVDHALGLAWEAPGGEHSTRPDQAEDRSRILSMLNLCGFANWRRPTIEEAFSLAHSFEL